MNRKTKRQLIFSLIKIKKFNKKVCNKKSEWVDHSIMVGGFAMIELQKIIDKTKNKIPFSVEAKKYYNII